MVRPFFRSRLRAFQAMLGDTPDPGFIATLEYLENRDLDLSIRIGGLLAFNALMTTIGTHPISASPGAPLSLDAPTQPVLTLLSLVGLLPLVWSSILCLRALLLGEEFETEGLEEGLVAGPDPDQVQKLQRRLFAAFIHSIDAQAHCLRQSVIATFTGGALTIAVWVAILWDKMA
ncbi:MAG: hypothetical protein MK060_14425 [Blastomonas sp.]|jgi:hypothetical protein|uniref:hypothetical protein n=1 Tax=unclassified Blastomonas TaxID=2626550 RepID=UPI000ABC025E|nr:hypothetical protein [Blastomonas sp.]MCH2239076.1 hypothetical protein [Blastomonas sp.]